MNENLIFTNSLIDKCASLFSLKMPDTRNIYTYFIRDIYWRIDQR